MPIQSIVSNFRMRELGIRSLSRMTVSGFLHAIRRLNMTAQAGFTYSPQTVLPHLLSAITIMLQGGVRYFSCRAMELLSHNSLVSDCRRLWRSACTMGVMR